MSTPATTASEGGALRSPVRTRGVAGRGTTEASHCSRSAPCSARRVDSSAPRRALRWVVTTASSCCVSLWRSVAASTTWTNQR